MSPTGRSLSYLRKSGYFADVCERWIAQAGVRKDLFGFIDVLAMSRREPHELLGVQATSLSNVNARLNKARSNPHLALWLKSPARSFEVWGWGKSAKGRWHVRRVAVRAEDLEPVTVQVPPKKLRAVRQRELFAS